MTPKTKSAFIIRAFHDDGTGRSFIGGKTEQIEEGAFGNYKAAGLVREPDGPSPKIDDGKAKTAVI